MSAFSGTSLDAPKGEVEENHFVLLSPNSHEISHKRKELLPFEKSCSSTPLLEFPQSTCSTTHILSNHFSSNENSALNLSFRKESPISKSNSLVLDKLECNNFDIESTQEKIAKLKTHISSIRAEMKDVSQVTSSAISPPMNLNNYQKLRPFYPQCFSEAFLPIFEHSSSPHVANRTEVENPPKISQNHPPSPSTVVAQRILSVNREKSQLEREKYMSRFGSLFIHKSSSSERFLIFI